MPSLLRPTSGMDHGFTLVELIVGMAIVAVLMGISIAGFLHVRTITNRHHAALVARSYDEVVGSFRRDHNGRPPDPAHTTPEWPASTAERGPIDVLRGQNAPSSQGRPYLGTSIPDDVRAGDIGVQVGRAGSTPAGTRGKIGDVTYTLNSANATYDIVASVDGWSCYMGTSARAIAQRGATC